MHSLGKKKPLVPVASATFAGLAAFMLFPVHAFARGASRDVDVSLTGSYATNISQYYESERQNISGAIGLHITETVGVSVGHNLKAEKNTYNDKYREALEAKGVQLPEGAVEQTRTERNNYVNATVSQWISSFRTTIGGGAFWRTSCSEDTFQDDGCNKQDVTWNVTLALEYVLGMRTSFKVSHQLSPSEYQGSGAKNLDKVWTTGLSWSL